MTKEDGKNCGNCKHCVAVTANRRFRCTAIPRNPGEFWDGFAEQHWCGVYWEAKAPTPDVTKQNSNSGLNSSSKTNDDLKSDSTKSNNNTTKKV